MTEGTNEGKWGSVVTKDRSGTLLGSSTLCGGLESLPLQATGRVKENSEWSEESVQDSDTHPITALCSEKGWKRVH